MSETQVNTPNNDDSTQEKKLADKQQVTFNQNKPPEKKRSRKGDILSILIGIFIVGLVAYSFLGSSYEKAPSIEGYYPNSSKQVPFVYSNKVTLVEFWFPSCPSCLKELPKLITLDKQFKNTKFQIVSISITTNTPDEVLQFKKEHNLDFTVFYDYDNLLQQKFGIQFTPTYYLIDSKGEILNKSVGGFDLGVYQNLIKKSLSNI